MSIQKRNFILYFFGSLVVIFVLFWTAVFSQARSEDNQLLKVTFFDVGQGDSAFIETPGGRQILIDGGPDNTILRKLGEELPFYDRDIDLVILTHPEADHLNGIIEVLKSYNVHLVADPGIMKDTGAYQEYQDVLEESRVPYRTLRAGDRIVIGENIVFDILNPQIATYREINNNSIVARLTYKKHSFLFTADIEKPVEYELAKENAPLIDSDVLKVGHHGSKTSSTKLFLAAVSPDLAVISVGRNNSYGHPTQDVLENLKEYGIKVLRTDIDGDVKVLSDGENLTIE